MGVRPPARSPSRVGSGAATKVLAGLLGVALLVGAGRAGAEEPAAPATQADRLARAKDLFRAGVALMDAGDPERALDHFLRSRDAYPSRQNTANAAICLDRLGRYDEALEMYEALLTRFQAELDADDRTRIGPAMAALRARVGGVSISSNVEALVVIDGRPRGRLPLAAPVRLAAGRHTVRVIKDGHATFEATLLVKVGEVVPVDAPLVPLAGAGSLRVEEAGGGAGAAVVVDRVKVGVTPWEGPVGAGRHVVWTERGDAGAPPAAVIAIEGQTTLLRVRAAALGGAVHLDAEPTTAALTLDGVALGPGPWELRLSPGAHVALATEEGYRPAHLAFSVGPPGAPALAVRAAPTIDPGHPRWPRPRAGAFFGEASGGAALSRALRADADLACPARCAARPLAAGYLLTLRAGFRWSSGLGVDLGGGYASFGERVDRSVAATYAGSATGERHVAVYAIHDDVRVRGPFFGAGPSFSRRLRVGRRGPVLGLSARVTVGLLLASAVDPLTGRVTVEGASAGVTASRRDEVTSTPALLLVPELGGHVNLGPVQLGLGLAAAFLPTAGPRFTHAELGVKPLCGPLAEVGTPGCVPNTAVVAGERAFGPALLWVPTGTVTYGF